MTCTCTVLWCALSSSTKKKKEGWGRKDECDRRQKTKNKTKERREETRMFGSTHVWKHPSVRLLPSLFLTATHLTLQQLICSNDVVRGAEDGEVSVSGVLKEGGGRNKNQNTISLSQIPSTKQTNHAIPSRRAEFECGSGAQSLKGTQVWI